jgi:hypothetical protein
MADMHKQHPKAIKASGHLPFQLENCAFTRTRELFDGKESNETACVDPGASPIPKDDGSEENARCTYRQDAEANRGCHAAKGFQHGFVARLASLRLGKQATGFSQR